MSASDFPFNAKNPPALATAQRLRTGCGPGCPAALPRAPVLRWGGVATGRAAIAHGPNTTRAPSYRRTPRDASRELQPRVQRTNDAAAESAGVVPADRRGLAAIAAGGDVVIAGGGHGVQV